MYGFFPLHGSTLFEKNPSRGLEKSFDSVRCNKHCQPRSHTRKRTTGIEALSFSLNPVAGTLLNKYTGSGCKPVDDVKYPDLQTLEKLVSEVCKVNHLFFTFGNTHFTFFTSPLIHLGLEKHKNTIYDWFAACKVLKFSTSEALLDWFQACTSLSFTYKASQDTVRRSRHSILNFIYLL